MPVVTPLCIHMHMQAKLYFLVAYMNIKENNAAIKLPPPKNYLSKNRMRQKKESQPKSQECCFHSKNNTIAHHWPSAQ